MFEMDNISYYLLFHTYKCKYLKSTYMISTWCELLQGLVLLLFNVSSLWIPSIRAVHLPSVCISNDAILFNLSSFTITTFKGSLCYLYSHSFVAEKGYGGVGLHLQSFHNIWSLCDEDTNVIMSHQCVSYLAAFSLSQTMVTYQRSKNTIPSIIPIVDCVTTLNWITTVSHITVTTSSPEIQFYSWKATTWYQNWGKTSGGQGNRRRPKYT